jgi:hypothetical protein
VQQKRLCGQQGLVFGIDMHGFVRQLLGVGEVETG